MKRKLSSDRITRDRDIRAVLLPMLFENYLHSDSDLALQEFDCNRARVDVAVMNGVMHGFEIKSDSDSLCRLDDQIYAYEGVFDLITVVVGKRLIKAVEEELPVHCGIILATRTDDRVKLTHRRKARKNPNQRKLDLARLLWKNEALNMIRSRQPRPAKSLSSRNSADTIWRSLAEIYEAPVLANAVRQAIKLRRSTESASPSVLGDDSSTTESTALLDHYSENLRQLLSVLSQNHPC